MLRDADRTPYLITNRHVVTGQNSLDGLKVPDNSPVISALRVAMHKAGHLGTWMPVALRLGDDDGRPYWLEHPDHGPWMDVIALPLGSVLEDDGLDLISYPHLAPAAKMGLGTELQVIGFPIGFDPIHDGAPLGVWTRGTIAWPPSLPWRNLPAFLIDCRSRPGQSGSPVIFAANEFIPYRSASGPIATGPVHELIGVYTGRIHEDSDIWRRMEARCGSTDSRTRDKARATMGTSARGSVVRARGSLRTVLLGRPCRHRQHRVRERQGTGIARPRGELR